MAWQSSSREGRTAEWPGAHPNPGVDLEALERVSPGPGPSSIVDLDFPSLHLLLFAPRSETAHSRDEALGTASEHLSSSPDFRLPVNPLARHLIPVSTTVFSPVK